MFSGIVERTGLVRAARSGARHSLRIGVDAGPISTALKAGSSLAVNGVCLTVVRKNAGTAWFDLSPETVRRTTLGRLRAGDTVNLERPLRFGRRIDGHFVLGHVDGVGRVAAAREWGRNLDLDIVCPEPVRPYLTPKGSMAVDGVGLTIGRTDRGRVRVHLVPQTLRVTTLGRLRPGDRVNLEADILAKLVFAAVRKGAIDKTRHPR